MKRSDKNYMKVYYQLNKEKLLEKKRENYANNKHNEKSSFYLEKRKIQNKKYYHKRKDQKQNIHKFSISHGYYKVYFD